MDTLDELYQAMKENNPSVFDERANGWRSDLPVFGGEEPKNTESVWSWDTERVIVGTCADDLEIVPRKEVL